MIVRLFYLSMATVVLAIGIVVFMPAEQRTQTAQAAFDHSGCQYPDRWTNPADGCDNSDPAVPECIKASSTKEGEDACIAVFVYQHQQTNSDPVITPAPAKVSECEGK